MPAVVSRVAALYTTSIGRKTLVAISGLFLSLFLVVHLSGNFLLFSGREAFNAYTEFMSTNPIIRISEIILFAAIFGHIIYALVVNARNRQARPEGYKRNRPSENSDWFSRNMVYTGLLVLAFLALHLYSFFFKSRILGEHDMYGLVEAAFADGLYSGFYVIAIVALGLHLNHGFQSAFQTLGLQINKNVSSSLKKAGTIFAILICAGFISMPVYFYLKSLN